MNRRKNKIKKSKIWQATRHAYLESEKSQQGEGLKILTPNQMLSRLPISLTMKWGNYCTLCTDQNNLQNNSIKVWLTLFKDGNNFYKQRK